MIYLDGLFTINLESTITKDGTTTVFGFLTKPDPYSTRKSPAGMFQDDIIPNDLGFVVEKMEEYYNYDGE